MNLSHLQYTILHTFPEVSGVAIHDKEVRFLIKGQQHRIDYDPGEDLAGGKVLARISRIVTEYRASNIWAGYETYWHAFAGRDAT